MSYSVYFANYTIGEDAYEHVNEVCSRFGSRALLIGGELALKAGKEKLLQALKNTDSDSPVTILDTVLFGTDCTYRRMDELAALAKELHADMIFGMGGGKALDTAKGTAEKAGLPVFTFPTIAATCAATTALSVVYKEEAQAKEMKSFLQKLGIRTTLSEMGVSLVQIIYLTEVGTIIIKSEIPLNFWKLLVIFLERTLIAIPLIVLFANVIGL